MEDLRNKTIVGLFILYHHRIHHNGDEEVARGSTRSVDHVIHVKRV